MDAATVTPSPDGRGILAHGANTRSLPLSEVTLNFDSPHLIATSAVGLAAGVLGGLAGIGGSMVMLPALHFLYGDEPRDIHHMYMAAAMTVNILVSIPAARRHYRARAVRTDLLKTLLITTAIAMVIGVLVGNLFPGDALKLLLSLFLACYCLFNLARLIHNSPEHLPEHERTSRGNLVISGAGTGMIGGLLGLGGGVLLVPMLQMLCRVPLRHSIATSSAIICMTAVIGAGLKLASLGKFGQSAGEAISLALIMGPTAVIGGSIGAMLTHKLPIRAVRIVVTLLLMVVAWRLSGLHEWVMSAL